jgi:Mn-dependent DtxR family transcriptional regulator
MFSQADYKTVANAVARLYEDGKIKQDKDGKFELTQSAEA